MDQLSCTKPPICVVFGVTVTTGERTDAQTGQRWLTADVTLAPLGAGDYVVEVAIGSDQKVVTAIRVGR